MYVQDINIVRLLYTKVYIQQSVYVATVKQKRFFFSLMRDRKGVDSDGRGGRKKLGGVE